METNKSNLSHTIDYYHPLLQRYARFIINDEEAAASLAKKVLDDQYDINGLIPAKHLRQVLKIHLLNRCYYWKQSQIFDRAPQKIPRHKYASQTEGINENESPLSN